MSNRANAKEWHQEQKRQKQEAEDFVSELETLRYVGEKRHGMPDPDVFARRGLPEVARKIREASALLESAYDEASQAPTNITED